MTEELCKERGDSGQVNLEYRECMYTEMQKLIWHAKPLI